MKLLLTWLNGNESISPINFFNKYKPNLKNAFIGLDECIDLHKVNEFNNRNLETAWYKTREYIHNSFEILNIPLDQHDISLDNEEKYIILNTLGDPPECSYNIYLITIYNDTEEKLVYIGKTDSLKSRFSNGHLAALKLHNPIYSEYKKRVYFGTIVFLTDKNEYLPLEYITPLNEAKKLLSYTEAALINYFKPELNTQYANTSIINSDTIYHIQNFTCVSNFLHDTFCYPLK